MKDERYTIQVSDNFVEIKGDLTIEEAFDYINFFDKKGFKSITSGWDNSTMLLSRKGVEEKWEEIEKKERIESESMYENLYKQLQEKERISKRKIEELENLMRAMFSDENEKVKKLQEENDILIKKLKIMSMKEGEEIKKLLQGFSYQPSEVAEDAE